MKFRIVKRAGGLFVIEQLAGITWIYVNDSTSASLESVERKFEDVLLHGEPQDEVIREVEVGEVKA